VNLLLKKIRDKIYSIFDKEPAYYGSFICSECGELEHLGEGRSCYRGGDHQFVKRNLRKYRSIRYH
jgi:hypothetical protein